MLASDQVRPTSRTPILPMKGRRLAICSISMPTAATSSDQSATCPIRRAGTASAAPSLIRCPSSMAEAAAAITVLRNTLTNVNG